MTAANLNAVKDSLVHELSLVKTPQDSIPILYHLFDISTSKGNRIEAIALLFSTAARANDVSTELDVLRTYCNMNTNNDSLMNVCLQNTQALPQSNERDEAITFIEINRVSLKTRTAPEAEKIQTLQRLIKEYQQGVQQSNLYDEIKQLYTLCLYLSHSTTGELYTEYLEKLHILINKLPADGRKVLPNFYYTQLAIIYTQNHQYQKAIEADKELIKIIHHLEHEYKSKGRIFRNYDIAYYNCYRRILRNYPSLSPEEIEYYYQQIIGITLRNKNVEKDFKEAQRPLIYYLIAKKEYAQALPIIKQVYNNRHNRKQKMELLQLTIEAAKAVNDKATLLQSTTEYNAYLEEYNKLKAAEKYKELQILYDVNELKTENAQLELEKKQAEIDSGQLIIHITFIAITILLCLLAIALWLYYHTRRLARSLQHSKQKLQEEQAALLQTQKELTTARDQAESANRLKTFFIQNMSHEIRTPLNAIVGFTEIMAESARQEQQEEWTNYAELISSNSELLLTLVGDVLDIARMESGEIKLNKQPCSLQAVCNISIDSVKHRCPKDVKMYFRESSQDFILQTDAVRVEQVLTNFLTNAAKFTNKGEIVLSYDIDQTQQQVIFSVTDTGIGVPKDKAEVIFERFEKLDSFAQGTGLGLHICRLIAKLLQGKVMVDTSYTQGARFIFIHPIKQ